MQKLRQHPEEFEAVGFARSPQKAEALFGSQAGFFFGDLKDKSTLESALADCKALVILTSAIPQMKAPPQPGEQPEFFYPVDEMPEAVDYRRQVNQIDAAKAAGVEQIVLVGSMGGSNENHPLNSMGNGKILIWKRKAEDYLTCIIHNADPKCLKP